MLSKAIDPSRIVFSDESGFVFGSDGKGRHIRHGTWNGACCAEKEKLRDCFMIWSSIGVDFMSAAHCCSNGIDVAEY
jgi:hypothetical protein